MPFLKSITVNLPPGEDRFPYNLPALRGLTALRLSAPITFFAGENGSGKSTLLEAVAAAAESIPVRDRDGFTAQSLVGGQELAQHLQLAWSKKTRRGFFLRAEDFLGYKGSLAQISGELEATAQDFDERFTGHARDLARGAVLGQPAALIQRYGENLDARSHGESFLHFFHARFTGPGLYLLDEPDTALSAQSVLALMVMLNEMVRDGAQFIIATHHPILLALPNAVIYSFDRIPAAATPYDELEGVSLLRGFLAHPDAYLRQL